jgi:hypothetical protein
MKKLISAMVLLGAATSLSSCYVSHTDCYYDIYGRYYCYDYYYGYPYYSTYSVSTGSTVVYYADGTDGDTAATPPPFLAAAKSTAESVNATLRLPFDKIQDLLTTTPSQGESTRVFGPKAYGNVDYRFRIKKEGDQFLWELASKPTNAPKDGYTQILTAHFTPFGKTHRGTGDIGVDLSAMAKVDATVTARGQLFGVVSGDADQLSFKYKLVNLTPDPATTSLNAVIGGVADAGGTNDVVLAGYVNLSPSQPDALDFAVLHARWNPLSGGRVDLTAAGADLGAGKLAHGSVCFSHREDAATAYTNVCLSATGDAPCDKTFTSGDVAQCAAFPTASFPGADANATPQVVSSLPAVPEALPIVSLD